MECGRSRAKHCELVSHGSTPSYRDEGLLGGNHGHGSDETDGSHGIR